MRAILLVCYFTFFNSFPQVKLGSITELGANRIGLSLSQGMQFDFGEDSQHSISLGAKWYGIDVVFKKEVVAPLITYAYRFNQENIPVNSSLGFATAFFFEKEGDRVSRVQEYSIISRFAWNRWKRFKPFFSLGVGLIVHKTEYIIQHTSAYFNYLSGIGIILRF